MFQIYKTLIQLMKHKQFYQEFHRQVLAKDLDDTAKMFIDLFGKYFKLFDDATVQLDSLLAMMVSQSSKEEHMQKVAELWHVVQEEPPEGAEFGIAKGLAEIRCSSELSELLIKYEAGDEVDLYTAAVDILDQFGRKIRQDVSPASDRWDVLKADAADPNRIIRLPLTGLQEAMCNVTTKTQTIIAARPDRGKTSFCSFIAVALAKQTKRPIMVLNNEGTKDDWMRNMYRSALGKSTEQLLAGDMRHIQEEYDKLVGKDKFIIVDIHGWHINQCERLIQKHRPFAVFWDMLDSVRGYDGVGKREDQRLEMLYQKSRELAVIYDHISFPTSQLSAEAEGKEYPTMDMLAGSKTAKQGACTAIIMLGHSSDPTRPRERYISCPKNKFSQANKNVNKGCYQQVWFEWETARFKESK